MSNMYAGDASAMQDKDIDLSMIFNMVMGNKWLIAGIVVVTMTLGGFYASRQIPQYQSELLLQIKSNREAGSNLMKTMPQFSFGGMGDNAQATQIALIKSRFILAPVVHSLGLDISVAPQQSWLMRRLFPIHGTAKIKQFDVPLFERNKKFSLNFNENRQFSLYNAAGKLVLQGPLGKLVRSKDQTISLQVDSVDAPLKTTFILQKRSDASMIASLKGRLSINDLGDKRQNTGVIELILSDPNPQKVVETLNAIGRTIREKDVEKNAVEASKTLEFLYKQLPITKHDLEKSETKLNRYRAKSGKIDIKLQSSYLLDQLKELDKQLNELRIKKIDMLQRYTEEHPYIIALNTTMKETDAARSKLESELKKLPASDQIAVNLMRDVEVKNSLYMVLLNKIQELQVVKAGIVSDVRILSFAKLPNEPLPLKSQFILMASFLLGLMLSFSVIVVRKLLHPRVDDPRWSEQHFDLVNLAIIPFSKEQTDNLVRVKGQTVKQLRLLAHVSPRNLAIESLRSLRTTLQVRLSCEAKNNIVAILGASPGVGKSFVSANLAYLLATAGKRVVLVDTDLRRGTLHKYFDVSPAPGLAEVLNQKKTLAEALLPTVQENLMILPRGTYPADPSELLSSDLFKQVVATLSDQFDIVIIDTPPVLLVTDAVLIGLLSGTNYLVVGANVHQPTEIEMTIKRLTNSGVPLHGSIFNFHKQQSHNQQRYYRYNYYYDASASS